jgi:hypothetical protein
MDRNKKTYKQQTGLVLMGVIHRGTFVRFYSEVVIHRVWTVVVHRVWIVAGWRGDRPATDHELNHASTTEHSRNTAGTRNPAGVSPRRHNTPKGRTGGVPGRRVCRVCVVGALVLCVGRRVSGPDWSVCDVG